jgi:DNA polymerase III alpha subunit (gram-positive type)
MIGPNDRLCVFDVEADGINPSKIHCLTAAVYSMGEWRIKSTTDYDEMRKFFTSSDVLIGHNIYRWDIPVVQRLLGIKVTAQIVDTLALSWYLYPTQGKHGL